MGITIEERIAQLEAARSPVLPADTMAEAGRKLLLAEFIRMLQQESGSRTGTDAAAVHKMRVAIRRMRSTFRLLRPYFRAKDVRAYNRELRRIASVLGDVRDLDVLIDDLETYRASVPLDEQADLTEIMSVLDQSRQSARAELVSLLDGKRYRRFLKAFSKFVTAPSESVRLAAGSVVPVQVRHLLPRLIEERLASVLAYDPVLDMDDDAMLHALRIELKRLRYAASLFQNVLGSQIAGFIDELKALQDCLGELQDAVTARLRLGDLLEAEGDAGVLMSYIVYRESRAADLKIRFAELWRRFNTRKVQQKLSGAVLSLR